MGKGNKMYSLEIVDKAISTTAMGFSCYYDTFKKNLEELPEEIKDKVSTSVLAGYLIIHMKVEEKESKIPEIEKKVKKTENPTKEDADNLLEKDFDKTNKKE